jgi:hypothetical protein
VWACWPFATIHVSAFLEASDNTKYRSARMPDRDLALSESSARDQARDRRLHGTAFTGPMRLLDRRAVTVSYRFPAVAEPAGCQRTITPLTASQPRVLPLHRFLTAYPGELSRLELRLHDCGRFVASNRRGPGSSTSMRRLRGACDAGRKRRRSPRVSKKVIAKRDYLI